MIPSMKRLDDKVVIIEHNGSNSSCNKIHVFNKERLMLKQNHIFVEDFWVVYGISDRCDNAIEAIQLSCNVRVCPIFRENFADRFFLVE